MVFDPTTTAFLFPGQGSQIVGMGKALATGFPAARAVFLEAEAILGNPFLEIMWNGPETALNDTLNTQPALYIHSLAAYRAFQSLFPDSAPRLMAGHSLGQLSAIAAAGGMSFAEGLRLVRKRGELMKRAGEINPGGMAAILGVDILTLEKVCAEASLPDENVQVANDNCPGQVVISGHKSALERAMAGAKAAGAKRALPLAVSIAAHSPLMASIQMEWDEAVQVAVFSNSMIPVVGNVSAAPITDAFRLRADVMSQMQSRVRWTESIKWMAGQGVTTFVENGTGTVLGGLVKRIVDGVVSLPLGNPVDFEALK
jgi:[acyl-carrier-protein] S-malonyltransferase